jgi:hypothetical protein
MISDSNCLCLMARMNKGFFVIKDSEGEAATGAETRFGVTSLWK